MADILSQEEIDALLSATEGDWDEVVDPNTYTGKIYHAGPRKHPHLRDNFIVKKQRGERDQRVIIDLDCPIFVRKGMFEIVE
jgi:flagellar motor switch protein FliM